MMVVGAHHTAYHVSDLSRSIAFYRDFFGCEVIWERTNAEEYVRRIVGYPEAELHQALMRLPGSDHCLELIDYRGVERTLIDTSPPNPGTAHMCLLVTDLRRFYDDLRAQGVASVSEPVLVGSGVNKGRLCVYMIDPDGFRLELLEANNDARE
jgi:lactoylglutathione lyase